MVANITHDNGLCAIPEVERLQKQPTIARLLNELHEKLQAEQVCNPDLEVTKEFKKNLETLEKAYKDEIPKIIDSYQKEHQQNFVRKQLPQVEDYYKKLVNWTDDIDNPGYGLRKVISELRENSYEKVECSLKDQWDYARDGFKNGKCCGEQASVKRDRTLEEFEKYKKFKEQVTTWFKELEELYKKAEALVETENYKALYAYRLEFDAILHEVRQLKHGYQASPVRDHEWLKSMLTQCLWNHCIATYEYFYWQKNWHDIVNNEDKVREAYNAFKESRRDKFIREAQDVELPKDDNACGDDMPPAKPSRQPERVNSGNYQEY